MSLIVKAKVKEFAKGMNVSSDFTEKLDEEVKTLIKKAIDRAKANKRTTVMGKDV
ncbi:DUF1931 domain-containing protein [Candidatus Woesearchaeota archaeon]|nr:DUF1931 domain-containing protein [Candidatus Woesearchaeota archaeon]MBW3017602.1 DUF1931 domain-containing protein [Candidatus Woesearchaeota archaeon]